MGKYYDKLIQINENLTKETDALGIVVEAEENTIEIPKDSLTPDQKKEILADKGVDQKVIDNLKDDKEIDGALDATLNNDDVKNESGAVPLSDMDWDGPAILKYDNPNTPEWGGFYVTDEEWSSDIQRATEFDSKEAAQDKLDELADKNKDMDGKYFYIWSAKMKQEDQADESNEDVSEEVVIRMDDDDLDMHGYVSTRGGKELVLTDNIEEAQRFQHEELGQNRIEAICNKFHYDPSTFKTVSLDPRANEPYEDTDDFGENWVSLDPMHPGATTLP